MKIKRERQVRLDELLKYVWDNDINDTQFESDNNSWVRVDEYGDVVDVYSIEKSDLFTITEEVEITEETKMKRLVCVHSHTNNISCYNDVSIEKALHLASFNKLTFKQIYLQYPDGSIGELIWTKECGLVD
ncbi:hypothetical protein ETI08_01140 [Macrococcoides goetzii]|nr:hypothetical protein [Macrococcus goetzii]TDM47768.1 hypothetical protein ETI08_01140 [Macrococcus goetzii]